MDDFPPAANLVLDLSSVERATALNAWLAYHNLSKRELALRLGVGPSTVSRLISGQRHSPRLLQALARMGVPPELLP